MRAAAPQRLGECGKTQFVGDTPSIEGHGLYVSYTDTHLSRAFPITALHRVSELEILRPMNRLKEIRTAQRLTLEALAKRVGSTRGHVWKLETEQVQLTPRWLDRLGKALGVPGVDILAHPGKSAQTTGRAIPVIDYVQAGDWTAPVDPHPKGEGMDFVFANSRLSDKAFALEIRGTSMEPEFRAGDRVIVDPNLAPVPGDYVVAKLSDEGEATFKKYRPGPIVGGQPTRIELVPLNPDWPTMSIDKRHPGRILATMVEHHRYRRI